MLDNFVKAAPAISALIAGLALLIAALTFMKVVLEYMQQSRLKRFEKFQEFNKRLDAPPLPEIRLSLEDDNEKLVLIPYASKHEFLGIYEEIALSVNSGIISENVAYYMFGYYVIRCLESENFWRGDDAPDLSSYYWSLFRSFAARMQTIEKKDPPKSGTLRF